MLSGCKVNRFDNGTSYLNNMSEIDDILEVMMDEGKYGDDTEVPFNRASLYLTYNNGLLLIEAIQFSIFEDFDNETYHFNSIGCFNQDGTLSCNETSDGRSDSDELKDEINLLYAFDLFKNIDAIGIVNELKREFSISPPERILIGYHLKDVEGINEDQERHENRIFYYNNEFHYDDSYIPSDMMIEIRVDFITESEGEYYVVYFEIE
jgi:hypothetical protein